MARHRSTRITRQRLGASLGFVFVVYLLWTLWAEEKVRIVSKTLEHTDAGVVVSGEVYNAASAVTSVKVEVSFFNGSGHKLAEEVVELDNLPVGVSTSFHTQPKPLTDVRDYTIYINAGRNMYGN